jgi:ABC-type proline/glycine betaine transport system ATPase subunit
VDLILSQSLFPHTRVMGNILLVLVFPVWLRAGVNQELAQFGVIVRHGVLDNSMRRISPKDGTDLHVAPFAR